MGFQRSFSVLPSVAIVAIVLVAPLAGLGRTLEPEPGQPVLVVVPPWTDVADTVAGNGGIVLQDGRVWFLAIAFSPEPDFAAKLENAGALKVLGADALGFLCK